LRKKNQIKNTWIGAQQTGGEEINFWGRKIRLKSFGSGPNKLKKRLIFEEEKSDQNHVDRCPTNWGKRECFFKKEKSDQNLLNWCPTNCESTIWSQNLKFWSQNLKFSICIYLSILQIRLKSFQSIKTLATSHWKLTKLIEYWHRNTGYIC